MSDPIVFAVGLALFLFGMLKLSGVIQKLLSARIRADHQVLGPETPLRPGGRDRLDHPSPEQHGHDGHHGRDRQRGPDLILSFPRNHPGRRYRNNPDRTARRLEGNGRLSLSDVFRGALWVAGKDKWKAAGEATFYFGLMFFGLDMTARAAAPLRDNPEMIRFLRESTHPIPGLLIGLVFTAVVHASSIPISILVILAQNDLIGIENALPIVFGANIGTTATVILASFASNIGGKRTAAAHLLFKFTGAAVALAGIPLFIKFLNMITTSTPQQIALGHFFFNVLILLIFIFILKPFSAFLEKVHARQGGRPPALA